MDIDGDGRLDIVGGSYMGNITYYKGTENGFEPSVEIKQTLDLEDTKIFMDILFADATFGDFNGDGLLDAFYGGWFGPRVAINEGTAEKPVYGKRLPLMRTDGKQVANVHYTPEMEKIFEEASAKGELAGGMMVFHTYVLFTDWDNDGVGDLLTTQMYSSTGDPALFFHKGVKTESGLRFEEPVDLLVTADGSKALPGSEVVPFICDFNNDGVTDMLLGVSVKYDKANGLYNDYLNSNYSDIPELKKKFEEIMDAYDVMQQDTTMTQEMLDAKIEEINQKYYVGPEVEKTPVMTDRGIVLLVKGKK